MGVAVGSLLLAFCLKLRQLFTAARMEMPDRRVVQGRTEMNDIKSSKIANEIDPKAVAKPDSSQPNSAPEKSGGGLSDEQLDQVSGGKAPPPPPVAS
jgi:hypothetical protein